MGPRASPDWSLRALDSVADGLVWAHPQTLHHEPLRPDSHYLHHSHSPHLAPIRCKSCDSLRPDSFLSSGTIPASFFLIHDSLRSPVS